MSSFLRVARRWRFVAVAASLMATSCGKCGSEEPKPAAEEPPAPAPEKLLADVYLASPNTSWAKLQRGIGGPVGILPASAGGILCAGLGIDPAVAFEIDGSSPGYAVVAGDPASPAWAFAMKLVNVPRARSILVEGDTARFTPREGAGYTELLAKGGQPQPQAAVALSKNGFLVVARKAEDLPALAPYVSRTLPKRPAPAGAIVADVPRASIATVLKPKLEATWADARRFLLAEDERARKDHGGRAPDYGDPQAIVAALDAMVARRFDVLGDLEHLRLSIETDEQSAALDVTMTPAAGDGPATKWLGGMRVGDANVALSMPATSALAASLRDSDEDREQQGIALENALTSSLGARLGEGEKKRLHDVAAALGKTRGEALGLALAWDDPSGVFVRTAVKDPEAAALCVKGALDLSMSAPFKEILRAREMVASTGDVAGLGKANVATITREAAPPQRDAKARAKDAGAEDGGAHPVGKAKAVGVAWLVDGGTLSLATGQEPLVTLRLGSLPDKKLGDEPQAVRALGALGATASTIVVAQPLRFDPARANLPAAPVVIAVGKKQRDGFVRVDLSTGVLREISRFLMGI